MYGENNMSISTQIQTNDHRMVVYILNDIHLFLFYASAHYENIYIYIYILYRPQSDFFYRLPDFTFGFSAERYYLRRCVCCCVRARL